MDSVESEIQALIAAGKCKQAVELAKEHHKKAQSAESRRALVQAYLARIQQFQAKGMAREAQTLSTLVQERFPAERQQLLGLEIRAMADVGRIDDLLRPLASDQASAEVGPEVRAQIEAILSRNVTDLPAVAACASLPADHSLRKSAAAIWSAFTAVTSGPVTDEEISLPEVSRRSPFAAWKMLIRAIAAFYREDDAGCRRALDAIPADSAVVHVAQTVRSLVDATKPSAPLAVVLYDRVLGNDDALRAALQKIEVSFRYFDLGQLTAGIRESVRQCSSSRPELLERMRQHISIACMLHEVPVGSVVSALGPSLKNAYFWKLHALASESIAPSANAALSWERFLRHAIHEKMFTANSAEAAAIWLHIAELLAPVSLEMLTKVRDRVAQSRHMSSYYADQPVEIARVQPASDWDLADFLFAPGRGFEQAALIRPDTSTFTKWIEWAQRWGLPTKQQEVIASAWHKVQPGDVQPLLILSSLAEARNALSIAVKRITEAEAADPMNHQVRRARVRLTLAITWRHFTDGKAHLVEKDIAELESLPAMNDGERAGVLELIRGAWHQMRGDREAENRSFQAVADRLGFLTATVLFESVKAMAKLANNASAMLLPADVQPLDVAKTQATVIRVADDLKLRIHMPVAWTPIVQSVLRQRPCPLSNAELLLLGRGGILISEVETAYLASAAGLVRPGSPAGTARFLLLRANCLNEAWHRPRAIQCLRAALELARQAHDQDLIRDIFAVVDRDRVVQRYITDSREPQGLSDDLLRQIVETESRAEGYPKDQEDIESFVVREAIPRLGGRLAEFEDDDEAFDLEDDEGFFGPGIFGEDDDDEDGDSEREMPELNERQLGELMNAAGVSSPEETPTDPAGLIAALAKMMGKKMSPADIRAVAEELSHAIAPRQASDSFDKQSNHRRKDKRR